MFTPTIEKLRHMRAAVVMLYLRAILVIGMLAVMLDRQQRYEARAEAARVQTTAWHRDALQGRQLILEMEKHNEAMQLNFELRTVGRWRWLLDNNPGLKVPVVQEPIDPPFVNPETAKRP